ncbi:uncharacterized protein ASPGLDRAFT_28246 [Aspergillus glaucus CBS 516.65]|uniref:Uncharacterized protein n=1 Tax=Aspergillus glaucus CBS 516.65 TaxID=1160497 RepID=A0A1L9VBX1_ASPGL|nr:hypothetical protein ASPGLDRAFT_28246 [Aspergillus glaucus CBS 516.65]OJJ81427.1 hypothetical protein ASPGLDRAFT_28246 [Aspergillus glaucus CBS 516.65]
METINRALDSASHAIWGETHPQHQQHGEEPLSGVQGQGKATDPYDAGNRDVQPDAPSTKSPTATTPASQKKSVLDPTGRSSEPLSPAISEDADPQIGGYPRPGTGNGFTPAGLASGVPEEPGLDADPVLDGGESSGVDPKSVSQAQRHSQNQYQGMANATGVPEGEQRTVMGNNPPGLNSRTSMGPGLGAMGEPSAAVAGGSAGGAAGGGAGIGGGAAAAGSTAGRGDSSTGQAAEQRASSGGGGESVQYGKPSGENDHQVSEEALKGPQGPPPKQYEFEKEMEEKPASKGAGGGQSQPQGGKSAQNGNGGHHHFKAMEKMKEKMGRATKAGTHK